MEAQSESAFSTDGATATTICAECEQPTATTGAARSVKGASLCGVCVAAYYVACGDCGGLVAKDETHARGDGVCCEGCFSKPPSGAAGGSAAGGGAAVDETLIETLIAEYVALHAEEKRISERMEVVKEQLKNAATARRREGSTVTLRADDAAIRCNYRTTLKCRRKRPEAMRCGLNPPRASERRFRSNTLTSRGAR